MKYYESTRKMQGASVGTILPWSGDRASIPQGWLECTGQTLEGMEYPILASVLGNTYGPTGGLNGRAYGSYISGDVFRLPNLNGRVLTDYEPSYVSSAAQYAHLQMGQTAESNSVGGLSITSGEIDDLRASTTYTFGPLTADDSTGSGLTIVLDVDSTGRAAVTSITDGGTGYAINDTITIQAVDLPSGVTPLVLKVEWILPSVNDVLIPQGGTQLISGDGSGVSPATSMNAPADVNFTVSDSGNLTGQIKGFTVNPPSYFKTFYVIPRKLSKDHMPSHRHSNPANLSGYPSALLEGEAVEGFECPTALGCCEGNDKEAQILPGGDAFSVGSNPGGYGYVTRYSQGVTLVDMSQPRLSNANYVGSTGQAYSAPQPVWAGPIPRPIGATYDGTVAGSHTNPVMSSHTEYGRYTSLKNWYSYNGTAGMIGQQTAADAIATNLFDPQDASTSKTFGTTLDHNNEYHQNQGMHSHYTFEVTMNPGYLKCPTIVPVDDIKISSSLSGTANTVAAQNIPSALNINVDMKTPSLSMMYLIRAF